MIATIEARQIGRYAAPMQFFVRLLALLAMVLMPFGMAAAPATPSERHHSSVGMEHCPEESSKTDLAGGPGGCAMPCSAALPAGDAGPIESPSLARSLVDSGRPPALAGLVPEIAIPPPKLA